MPRRLPWEPWIVLVPLIVRQIHSMQRLQALAPAMKAIQQKYKNDKRRQQEEIMRFYQENQVNPLASCLPLARLIADRAEEARPRMPPP